MDDVRILKGWTKKERKELEEAKESNFKNAIALINGIANDDDNCTFLTIKYLNESPDEDNQLARDIVDYYDGKAKFADQKYYVHLIKSDWYSYLNINTDGELKLYNRLELNGFKTKFTRDEVAAIDPKFVPFMEEVEDDE
ncbi:hypothetical protein [Companilactobacillus kimchii]|uniref:DUF1642 domain-containing protein n=2 Tax=Companilactobacillus kimchii TaxID=2801452 RepID=A0ABR5NWK4_9LACO|nr:hypothetical protein [Companilactobacillus kimchii]KAE9561303.1 hypothetical protein ATN91_07645 [Companilactobacillus kimchii]KRK53116.1 hypothetical protein FC97_GL001581 [Companilactobacillus kimchii DSM 13961 = JCM 10707]OWF32833.1 hypothetical protein LKACC12383_01706 [Companilactobacillus kimchii]GEO48480.1 hypothetical protein LKI01_24790 [Companilactobacillus paralimentarius]